MISTGSGQGLQVPLRSVSQDVWQCNARRLQSAPTTKYSRGLVVFIAFFVCKHGGGTVLDSIDALQPQPPLSAQILDSVWAPTLPQVTTESPVQ